MSATSPRDELNDLLSAAIALAWKLVEDDGAHRPFAMVITHDRARTNILADDTEVRDQKVLADTVIQTIRDMCARSELRAIAFAHNITYRSAQDGSQVDAIEVDLDHVDDCAITCMLPYSRNASGDYVEGQLFRVGPRIVFFSGEDT